MRKKDSHEFKQRKASRRAGFGRALRDAMHRVHMTQVELAALLGINQQAISDWCLGKKLPRSEEHREFIAKELGVKVD